MRDECVSIVIPVYNAARFIEETVNSVRAQTYTDWELILVNDASTDDSLAIMERLAAETNVDSVKITIINLPGNSKAAGARNAGIEAAGGRYLTFLDADDIWLPDKLSKQLDLMKQKDCAFSFTNYEFADETGAPLGKVVRVPERIDYKNAIKNTTIFTSTVMFDLGKLGKEQVKMPLVPSEDTATWWKVLKIVPFAYGLDEVLTLYRRSDSTLSSNKILAIKRIWNLYRNVEHFSVCKSAYCFCGYAVRAVLRRI